MCPILPYRTPAFRPGAARRGMRNLRAAMPLPLYPPACPP